MEREWRSGESARLPPLWSGFDSDLVPHVDEFGVGFAPKGFLLVSSFSSSTKTSISKFQFDQDRGPA